MDKPVFNKYNKWNWTHGKSVKYWLCIILLCIATHAKGDVVIINNSLNNQSKLYRYEIQAIFMLRQNFWKNGIHITPIFLPLDSLPHNQFVTDILNISPNNYNTIIDNKIQNGEASHVIVANNVNEVISLVKKISGSIAYITTNSKIKEDGIQVIEVCN